MPARSSVLRFGPVLVIVALLAMAPNVVGAQDDAALRVGTETIYSVHPAEGRVEVVFTYSFENPSDDVAFPGFFESLPTTAVEVAAVDGSRELAVAEVGESDGFTVWLVAFDDPIEPGDTAGVTLSWVIEAGAGDESPIVEDGAISFEAYVPGPQGASWAPARIEVPEGFVAVDGAAVTEAVSDPSEAAEDRAVFLAETAAPYQPVVVSYLDRSRFSATIAPGPPELIVADWTASGSWRRSVLERSVAIAPTLNTWFGPRVESLELRRALRGDGHAEVALDGDDPYVAVVGSSASTTDHQLAHAWLADVPVDEAWFVEGLAAAFAGDQPEPSTMAEIVAPLADEIGPSGVRKIIDALRASAITYPGVDVEAQPLPPDWRTLLDLFEGVGGATDAASLFRTAIVDDDGSAAIDRRGAARIDYGALEERAGIWTLPPLLREPMAAWDFDTFLARQGAVSDTLLVRDGVDSWAEELGLDRRGDAQQLFESATDDMAVVDDLLGTQQSALEAFSEAERLVNGDRGLLARVGLIRSDPDADLVALREMWASGDYEGVTHEGHELADLVEGAVGVGTIRLLVPAALLLAVWQAIRWLLRRSRGTAHGPVE